MPDFDAYLMVDWSASSRPAKGQDSIWYCFLTRTDARLWVTALENPITRHRAIDEIKEILKHSAVGGKHVLVGFDFPYGYPSGFATALRLYGAPAWSLTWRELASNIVDREDNSNNRFQAAAGFNLRISKGCYPFWGCPLSSQCATPSSTKDCRGRLSEKRLTDVGNMQPVWKLYGNGSVGSQALLGIPHLTALRNDPLLARVSRVWPFETGFSPTAGRRTPDRLILHAEIYPSLVPVQANTEEVKDAAQVRMLAAYFAALDDGNRLPNLFAGPAGLNPADRERVEDEEGWALGVGDNQRQRIKLSNLTLPEVRATSPVGGMLPSQRLPRAGTGRSTKAGYENRNGQVTIRCTGLGGTDHGQYVYVLRCNSCGHQYGANGSDIHIRRCPICQGGRPGLPY